MNIVAEIVMWLIVAALVVLAVTHPRGFSSDVSTVGSQGNQILGTLSGAGQTGGQ